MSGSVYGASPRDVAFVHNISPDFGFFHIWEQYDIARRIIRAWHRREYAVPILRVMEDADPDVCLCGG